jgi:hypothetical protein
MKICLLIFVLSETGLSLVSNNHHKTWTTWLNSGKKLTWKIAAKGILFHKEITQ